MSEFRLWVHRKVARLDETRERRFVALASALIFAVLSLGPQALRIVDAAIDSPDISIDELGAEPLLNPVRFKATVLNAIVSQVQFLVLDASGASTSVPGHHADTVGLSLWESDEFMGEPGRSYTVKVRYASSTTQGQFIDSSQSVAFSIFDPAQGAGTGTGTTGSSGTSANASVEIFQLVAWPGTETRIEARGMHAGFTATSAAYRVQSVTGLAFLGEFPAAQEAGGAWHALFPIPGGALYKATLIVREGTQDHASIPAEVAVPVEDATGTQTTTPAPTAPAPVVSLLLPNAGASLMSPVALAARVENATATSVGFEVLDPAGVSRVVLGAAVADGRWTAMFVGNPGQYSFGVRAVLSDGAVIPPTDFRPFSIAALPTENATTTGTVPLPDPTAPEPSPATTTPVVTPAVEIFSPDPSAVPFAGPVPISVRVRNGLPERVVAVVIGPNDRETIVVASKSATGDFWTALFDGPDGEYRFRVRASVAGEDYFAPERRFAVKRPAATSAPVPDTAGPGPVANMPILPSTILKDGPPPMTAIVPVDENRGGTSSAPTRPDVGGESIPEALRLECRDGGILPARCVDWLKAKHQSRECAEAGAVTREACLAVLGRLNVAVDETNVFGMATDRDILDAVEAAREVAGKAMKLAEMPPAIGRLLAFEPRPEERWRVMASRDDSPSLLILDNDGDGLPDDAERRFGTDPDAADTDGDGFSDGQEIRKGYNPLGPGALDRPLRGLDKATLENREIAQPRGSSAPVDPSFTIAAEAAAPASEDEVIRLSGKAAPNSVVSIFVYSYLPIVVTTTTDENGDWTYDFGSKLAEGRHEAYVSINDDTGKLVASSSPLAFFVKEAKAVSEEDFLRPDINVEEAPTTFSRWFVYGGIGLVALAAILVIAIVLQTRKSPLKGTGDEP